MDLFGFSWGKKKQEPQQTDRTLRLPVEEPDGSTVINSSGSSMAFSIGIDPTWKSEADMIQYYRDMGMTHSIDKAVDEIVSDAIVTDGNQPVKVNFENDSPLSDKIKTRIAEEFDGILKMMNFKQEGHVYFREWYTDGRQALFKVVDPTNTKLGIQDIQKLDVINLKKIKELQTERVDGVEVVSGAIEYFIYAGSMDSPYSTSQITRKEIRIKADAVAYATSGLIDKKNNWTLSYLHKAIRPYNHLRLLEDASLIYKLVRAPQRRVFYIDVGTMPRARAEEYMRDIMNQYRNKITYDATTGDVRDDRRSMAMLEDYWLARREGGKGTEISTLSGDVSQTIEDLEYFRRNLYDSLNVPVGRLEPSASFSLGRASEITRDELRMNSNVNKLRNRYSIIFYDLLKTQLLLKGVITSQEWDDISHDIQFIFDTNVLFAEMKESEILQQRLGNLSNIEQYIGKYFSKRWVQRNVLRMTDEEIADQKKEIESEIASGEYPDPKLLMTPDDMAPNGDPVAQGNWKGGDPDNPRV